VNCMLSLYIQNILLMYFCTSISIQILTGGSFLILDQGHHRNDFKIFRILFEPMIIINKSENVGILLQFLHKLVFDGFPWTQPKHTNHLLQFKQLENCVICFVLLK